MQNREEFFTPGFYLPLIFNGVRIVFIFLFAYLATILAQRLFRGLRNYAVKVMVKTREGSAVDIEKQAQTVSDVARKALVSVIWVVAVIMILQEMNFDVRPLLAGAGVIGVAVGFGAQSLVKDILAGFFMLLENQIRINDVVVINDTGGLVEEMNLRTIILRGDDGAVHIFQNGNITKLANLTREYAYAVFSICVNYGEDTDKVASVLTGIGAQVATEEPFRSAILAPIEVQGIDRLAESGVVVKARIKTRAMQQWLVKNEVNRRIRKAFDEAGIRVAFPARTIHVEPQIASQGDSLPQGIK